MKKWTNGYRTWGTVSYLSGFHRIPGSEGFDEAVEYLKEQLLFAGYPEDDVRVLEYPADGMTVTETWIHPLGWDLKHGELILVRPEHELLLTTDYTPLVVMVGSAPCDDEFEVVDVGKGEEVSDYEGKDVRGKLVLANGNPRKVYDLAVERYGARGMLNHFMRSEDEGIGRAGEQEPNAVNYNGLYRDRTHFERKAVGFSLPYAVYKRLKEMLGRSEVVVRARVSVNIGRPLKVLEARFAGENPSLKPIVVMAHLCHPSPGANDNASGSAALLEVARILKENALPLQRDVVFLWVPEMFGSVPYFLEDHGFWYGINLDMVGEDQKKTHSTFLLVRSPWSANGFVDHFMHAALIAHAPVGRRFEVVPYSGGSDHYVLESFGVGCPFLGHWPDTYYHTNFDTPQMVDPSELAWTVNAVVDVLLWTASARGEKRPRSTELGRVLSSYAKDLVELLTVMEDEDHPDVKRFLAEKVDREHREIEKILEIPQYVKEMVESAMALKTGDKTVEDEYYAKTFKGPLGNLLQKLTTFEERRELERLFPESAFTSNVEEILNLLDRGLGLRAVHRIYVREFSSGVKLENLKWYVEILESKNLLKRI